MLESIIKINQAVNGFIWGVPAMICIIGVGLLLSVRTRFIQVRKFGAALKNTIGKIFDKTQAKDGSMSPFQAVCTALAGTVGTGNIAGVAGAIALGGPGAIFWMWCSAFLGMCTKFSEVTLAIHFREKNANGEYVGGPMYYIEGALKNNKYIGKFAPHLSKIYAICCIFAMIGGWNLFQINAMTTQITEVTGGDKSFFANQSWLLGLIVAVITYFTIIGGIKAIGKFTSKVTPVMCTLYVLTAFAVCIYNIGHVPHTFALILKEAFHPKALAGGWMMCMLWGFRRAMFANESGLGTAPIAFSAVKTNNPVAQAFIAMLQPFVDTVIVGSATAFVIVVSGEYLHTTGIAGIELTSKAFGSVCPFFPILLTFMASCFVLSTMLCGSYYGIKAWNYLFGDTKLTTRTFQVIYCIFIIIGSAMNFKSIINLSDAFTLFLAVPNLIAVFMLSDVIMKELKRYCKKYNVGLFKNNEERENDEERLSGDSKIKV